MTRITMRWLGALIGVAALQPAFAAAQEAAPQSVLQVEELPSGFVIAPDVRFTKVNDRSATLAGAYGGWLTERTLLLGAGAYWLTNRSNDFKMQYAGGLVRWTLGGDRRVALSTGDATLSRTYGDAFGLPEGTVLQSARGHERRAGAGAGQLITRDTRVWLNEGFFIAEPHVNALWSITPWMRLDTGVSYRAIGAADLLGKQLRGPSGTIALQFGGR
jgi:hypothetical protein